MKKIFFVLVLNFSLIYADQEPLKKIAVIAYSNNYHHEYLYNETLHFLKQNQIPFKHQVFKITSRHDGIHQSMQNVIQMKPDLILALGSLAVNASVFYLPETITLFASVYRTDRFDDLIKNKTHVKGVFSNLFPHELFRSMKIIFPDYDSVGLIYSENFLNHQVLKIEEEAKKFDYTLYQKEVKSAQSLSRAMKYLKDKIQLFYFLPDPLLMNSEAIKKLVLLSLKKGFFIFGQYHQLVEYGGFAAFEHDKEEESIFFNEMVQACLTGIDISDIKNKVCEKFYVKINQKAVKQFQIQIPEQLKGFLKEQSQ